MKIVKKETLPHMLDEVLNICHYFHKDFEPLQNGIKVLKAASSTAKRKQPHTEGVL